MDGHNYLSVAGNDFSEERAKAVIAGYALGTRTTRPRTKGDCARLNFEEIRIPRWGYQTYDCIQASSGPDCEPVDYLVVSGLNGRIDVDAVAALQRACQGAFAELAKVDKEVVFWELDEKRLTSWPESDSPEQHLWLAWCHMMMMPDLGVALTHKTLHHKRPSLFPLVDGRTAKILGEGDAWASIHRDLNQRDGQPFGDLEAWFAELVTGREGCVPVSRLRLHDILLWCRIMPDQEKKAASAGKEYL